MTQEFEIAVVGAGIAGLTCAQQLQRAGYQVVVVDKSRGLGGRMATRRYGDCPIDHGVRYLETGGQEFQDFVAALGAQSGLQPWAGVYQQTAEGQLTPMLPPPLIAPAGMTSVAKFLGTGLTIERDRRVVSLAPGETGWELGLEGSGTDFPLEIMARVLVLAIPAPQAFPLLTPHFSGSSFLAQIQAVRFDACITVMAGYASNGVSLPSWNAVHCPSHKALAWVGIDSRKRSQPVQPILVFQSNAAFAAANLEAANLEAVGQELLAQANDLVPWATQTDWFQVHRWRYAFPRQFLQQPFLVGDGDRPLVCCGDWCGGQDVEAAWRSGLAAAQWVEGQGPQV